MTLIEVVAEGKPFKHVGVYDSRWIDWSRKKYPILLSKEQITSQLWQVQGDRFLDIVLKAKKKSKRKKKVALNHVPKFETAEL